MIAYVPMRGMSAFEEFSKLVHSAKVVANHEQQVTTWERNERCIFFTVLQDNELSIAPMKREHVWATVADYKSPTLLLVRPKGKGGDFLIEYKALFDSLYSVVSRGRMERDIEAFLHTT